MELQGTASRSGCVPGGPFARVLQEWCDRYEQRLAAEMGVSVELLREQNYGPDSQSPMSRLAEATGIDISNLRKIKDGKREWIGFDTADKIVTRVDELSWGMNEELKAIYQGFDFEWLDRVHPCVRVA